LLRSHIAVFDGSAMRDVRSKSYPEMPLVRQTRAFFMPKRTEISSIISSDTLFSNVENIKWLERFVEFKRAFPNSVIYKYSAYRVEKLGRLKMSRNTIKNTIDKFIELGWATKNKSHLILISKNKLSALYGAKSHRKIKLDTTLSVKIQLQAKVFSRAINRSRYGKCMQEVQGKSIRRKYAKSLSGTPQELSSKKIGKIFNSSQTQALRVVRSLENNGWITVQRQKLKHLGKCSAKQWQFRKAWWNKKESVDNCFWHLGHFFHLPSNSYLMNSIP